MPRDWGSKRHCLWFRGPRHDGSHTLWKLIVPVASEVIYVSWRLSAGVNRQKACGWTSREEFEGNCTDKLCPSDRRIQRLRRKKLHQRWRYDARGNVVHDYLSTRNPFRQRENGDTISLQGRLLYWPRQKKKHVRERQMDLPVLRRKGNRRECHPRPLCSSV